MEFIIQKPIFLQICDIVIDKILTDTVLSGERLLSVRDMGESISVNPNTVQRSYAELQHKGIIEQKRGVGYFVSSNAKEIALQIRKDEFIQTQVPQLVNQMKIIGITLEELKIIMEELS